MIRLEKLNKTYFGVQPLHVLKGINLDIRAGELVSIMGASGSGKSTLLNILGLLDCHDSGEYYLNGMHIKNISENMAAHIRWRKRSMPTQSRRFNPPTFEVKNGLETA